MADGGTVSGAALWRKPAPDGGPYRSRKCGGICTGDRGVSECGISLHGGNLSAPLSGGKNSGGASVRVGMSVFLREIRRRESGMALLRRSDRGVVLPLVPCA